RQTRDSLPRRVWRRRAGAVGATMWGYVSAELNRRVWCFGERRIRLFRAAPESRASPSIRSIRHRPDRRRHRSGPRNWRWAGGRGVPRATDGRVMMSGTVLRAIGPRKGLFLATSRDGRASWELTGPHHKMTGVYAVGIDTRRRPARLLVGVTSEHFGPSVAVSDDFGASWEEPDHPPIALPDGEGAAP